MPASHETVFRVFYSWQSDIPDSVNLQLIRNALNRAAIEMNADHDLNLHVVIDEATRELSGSPNIAESIFAKIREADVFVCDLTKVAELLNAAGNMRKYCNPNVALELGYAVRVLGWNRIIIVFNEAYGMIPEDLPFDASGHRTLTYRCIAQLNDNGKPTAGCKTEISNALGHLRQIFVEALKFTAKEDPKCPEELEAKSPEEIRRQRDVTQLYSVFHWINLDAIDQFIDNVAQGGILYIGEYLLLGFSGVLKSSSFHITDTELTSRISNFAKTWRACFKYSQAMDAHKSGQGGYFRMPGDIETSPEQGRQFKYTCKQAQPLRASLNSLLDYVRSNYLEIDPTQTGKGTVTKYLDENKKF